jgi:hypothetical protein
VLLRDSNLTHTGLSQQAAVQSVVQSESQKQLQQCRFLLCQALDADEAGNKDEAVELYTQAVDLGIRAVSIQRERVPPFESHCSASCRPPDSVTDVCKR